MWGEGSASEGAEGDDPTLECCRPLGVEVYDLDDKEKVLQGWQEAQPNGRLYKGQHGCKAKEWGS